MRVNTRVPNRHDTVSLQELELYHLITAYRSSLGLKVLPMSAALTATAGRHVVDTRENIWAEGLALPRGTNLHSWSDAPYYADHRNPRAMWDAPERLGTGYTSSGYEISAAGQRNVREALDGWIGSPGHKAVLAQLGAWARVDFNAIGVGVETAPGAGPYGGRIYHVWFGSGADPKVPWIVGTNGHDRITGTAFTDQVLGGSGNDLIRGGTGNDRLDGGSGHDRLEGGSGNDRLSGETGNDVLVGGDGNDALSGGSDNDALHGERGNDNLSGGPGNDTFWGGPGSDTLSGGSGRDVFVFRAASDTPTGRGRDTVADFQPGRDKLHLAGIDARPSTARDDAFVFIGSAAFSGVAGQVRKAGALVEGDLNGDRVADFQIVLTGAPILTAGDFIL